MSDDIEEWRTVGADPFYEVSNRGRVRKVPARPDGSYRTPKLYKTAQGYWSVALSGRRFYVHRLVAEAFLAKPTLEVDHVDGNRANASVENLRWVTRLENLHGAMARVASTGRNWGAQSDLDDFEPVSEEEKAELRAAGLRQYQAKQQ